MSFEELPDSIIASELRAANRRFCNIKPNRVNASRSVTSKNSLMNRGARFDLG